MAPKRQRAAQQSPAGRRKEGVATPAAVTPARRLRVKGKISPSAATQKPKRRKLMSWNEIIAQSQSWRPGPTPAMEQALKAINELHENLEAKGMKLVVLEKWVPTEAEVAQNTIARDWLLRKDHLLLSKPLAEQACSLCLRLAGTLKRAGDQHMISTQWSIMLESMRAAKKYLRKTAYREALGELLGMLLFAEKEDRWLEARHNRTPRDWVIFCNYFEELSFVWATLLARSDEELGWATPSHCRPLPGVRNNYRSRIVAMLWKWQTRANEVLARYDRTWSEVPGLTVPIATRIFAAPRPRQPVAFEFVSEKAPWADVPPMVCK